MKVLIHIEEQRRDMAVLLALGQLFEQAGFRVIFSTRRTTPLFLGSLSFDAALLATPENIPYNDYPKLSQRSRLYMLPTEGTIFEEKTLLLKYAGGEDPERWETYIRGIRRFFLWGDYSRRVLRNTGRFREEQLTVVGAPRKDFLLVRNRNGTGNPDDHLPLGLITDFALANSCYAKPIFRRMDDLRRLSPFCQSSTRNPEDRFWAEHAGMRLTLYLLEECQRRNQRVVLRIHHRENTRTYDYLLKKHAAILTLQGNEMPFEAWLDGVGVVAGFNSTTFFETVAAGKPAINLDGMLGPRLAEHIDQFMQNHYPIMDHIQTPSSWEELFGFLERVRSGEWNSQTAYGSAARQILQDSCTFPRTASTLATIVQRVGQDLERSSPTHQVPRRAQEWSARLSAQAAEFMTFRLRRDPVGNCWFPLNVRRERRGHLSAIGRYLRAAQEFPAQASALKNPEEPALDPMKTSTP